MAVTACGLAIIMVVTELTRMAIRLWDAREAASWAKTDTMGG
jgi:hypothetical protein